MRKDGQSCSSQQEILQRWYEHYSEALNHPAAATCQELDDAQLTTMDDSTVPTDALTLSEVKSAINKLKLGRAPGGDCIAPEIMKLDPVSAAFALHDLFGKVWTSGHVPSEWKEAIITSLYKGKGPKNDCSSYRPISLLSVPGKVFTHVLLARINPLLKRHRRPQQSGFTAGRSTTDAILALWLLSELHRSSVAHSMWPTLISSLPLILWIDKPCGKPSGEYVCHKYSKLIEDLHIGTTSRVRLDGMMSDSFPTSSGVRQECILAPALFCRATDWIMERTARKAGVQVGDKLYTDLDYTDDVVLMAEQTETLRSTLLEFHQTAADLGLHLSWQKTKIQNLGSGDPVADITVAGNTVEAVTEFWYLGSIQSSSGRCYPDLLRWTGVASSAMHSMQRCWRQ